MTESFEPLGMPLEPFGMPGGPGGGQPPEEAEAAVDWSAALARTLADLGQPTVAAQPIVDLTTGEITGYELLARFAGPPAAPPNVWFAQADRFGLATALTERIVTRAFMLRPQLPRGLFLAINIEPHLLSDPAVVHALNAVPSLEGIVIELTGHTPVHDERALKVAVARVRSLGGLVAVDDAGTGYAGLRQLITVRPDIVKVDRALVAGIDTDPIRRSAVSLLGELVDRMNARLLAEGVETSGELKELASLGVPMAQGWIIARPEVPWPAVDPGTVKLIRQAAAVQATTTDQVARLVRDCAILDRTVWCASNVAQPAGGPRTTVVIDSDGRPIGVVAREARGNRYLAPVMAVSLFATPVEVARRAMARAACHMGVPLVCVDSDGHTLGIIDVAELVDAAVGTAHR